MKLVDYISTRDTQAQPAQFTDILLGGLAADGGLYLPTQYPQLDAETLANLREVSRSSGYAGLAAEILQLFVDDIPAAELEAMARRAYNTEKFAHEEIVPVTKLDEQFYIGHLSEGPTAAFKDMAMQLLGELFE